MGLLAWLAHEPCQRARGSARAGRERRTRGNDTVQDQHPHLRARVTRGERLPVGPHAQHRVAAARVELGYDGDPHRRR